MATYEGVGRSVTAALRLPGRSIRVEASGLTFAFSGLGCCKATCAERQHARKLTWQLMVQANKLFEEKKFTESIELYSAAIDSDPTNPHFVCNRFRAFFFFFITLKPRVE